LDLLRSLLWLTNETKLGRTFLLSFITFACVLQVTQVKNPKLFRMFKQTKDHFSTFLAKPTRFLFYGVPSEQKLETICHVGWNTPDPGGMRILLNCLVAVGK